MLRNSRKLWCKGRSILSSSSSITKQIQCSAYRVQYLPRVQSFSSSSPAMSAVDDLISSSSEKTFQYEDDLLSLTVPDLEHTARRYLESVKLHVSEAEYKNTESLVHQFVSGEGQYLQQKLQEKAKTERNWLAQWWEDVAYLEGRTPAPLINMISPLPYHEDVWPARAGSQVERAALALHYLLHVWQHVRRQTYKPIRDNRKRPTDMFQFKRIFNTCTVPGLARDSISEYFQTEDDGPCPSHVVVMCQGHVFSLECMDEAGDILTAPELQSQIQNIKDRCQSLGPAQGVSFLPMQERTAWAKSRNELIALNPKNREVLEKIQSSIITIGLDDEPGQDPTRVLDDATCLANKAMFGNGHVRWLDKSMGLNFLQDGLVYTYGDHTPNEGIMMVYVMDYIHKRLKESGGQWKGTTRQRSLPKPQHLSFALDTGLEHKITEAMKEYSVMTQSGVIMLWNYTNFGKNYCKEKRFHPDAVCQLAIHYAYYLLYGRVAPAYETASTKQFYRGRTETIRSCTPEVKAWCEAMGDPNIQGSQKLKLFSDAVNRHLHEVSECSEGRGIDRHLLGLLLTSKQEDKGTPALFEDPSFTKSGGGGNFILSTACNGYTSCIGGVLPMCPGGIGCFYVIEGTHRLKFFITTWTADQETNNKQFADAIGTSLDSIKAMIDQETSSAATNSLK